MFKSTYHFISKLSYCGSCVMRENPLQDYKCKLSASISNPYNLQISSLNDFYLLPFNFLNMGLCLDYDTNWGPTLNLLTSSEAERLYEEKMTTFASCSLTALPVLLGTYSRRNVHMSLWQ